MFMCGLPCEPGHVAASHTLRAIPLSVASRLEEDSVPNVMPYYMQPTLHPQLVGRSWMPSGDVSCEDKAQLSVSPVSSKTTSNLESSNDVKKKAPADLPQRPPAQLPQPDRVDNNTQTGQENIFTRHRVFTTSMLYL